MSESNTPLCKYYGRSAEHNYVFSAPDVDGAALRFAQLVLRSCVRGKQNVSSGIRLIDEEKFEKLAETFEENVYISESGFDGEHTGIFCSEEVLQLWKQQMESLESVIRKME